MGAKPGERMRADRIPPRRRLALGRGRGRTLHGFAWPVLLSCAAALSGCESFVAQPLAPESSLHAFETRSLDDAGLHAYLRSRLRSDELAPAAPWNFASLTLAAVYFSPDLDLARATRATADAAVTTAAQRPNPTLQLPFAVTTNPKAGESPYTLGLGLDIPIETAGKRGDRVRHAQQLSKAAQFEVGAAAWRVRSRLRAQLLELHVARRAVPLLTQQVQVRQQRVQLLDRRLAVGAGSVVELQQAVADLAQARLEATKAGQQAREALAGAAATIGIPASALEQARIRLDAFDAAPPDLPPARVRDAALRNRADVQAALARYEASQAALQLEVANQYPDLHLGPGVAYDAGAHKYALSLSGIALPLFNRNQGPIAEATARRQEAAARFEAVMAQRVAGADLAAARYQGARAQLKVADTRAAAQHRVLRAAQRAFAAGETDRLELTLAELQAGSADLARQDAFARLQQAAGEVEDAMQRPIADRPARDGREEAP